jgi:hypothetical protein
MTNVAGEKTQKLNISTFLALHGLSAAVQLRRRRTE